MKYFILLQLNFLLFSFSGVIAKFASSFSFLSLNFLALFTAETIILLIYAYFWQKLIKKFDISVAYANRGSVIIFNLIWSVMFFNETVTLFNILGSFIIIFGIYLLHDKNNSQGVYS